MAAHLDQELSAYLDGELAGDARAAVEAHLAQCGECRASLESLRGLVRRAQALDDRPPARDLWGGIAARIGDASTAVVVPLAPRRRRIAFSIPQLAAAGIALMALSAGTAVVMMRGGPGRTAVGPAAGPGAESRVAVSNPGGRAAVSPADQAMQSYAPAIRDLETVLATRRSQLDTSTVRVLEQSVRVIDAAIEQARQALAQDPNNRYLNSHLQRALDRKLDLLRRAATLPAVS